MEVDADLKMRPVDSAPIGHYRSTIVCLVKTVALRLALLAAFSRDP